MAKRVDSNVVNPWGIVLIEQHDLDRDGLWGLHFIDERLFFTAGIAHEDHGLFGVIEASHGDD